MQVAHVVGLWQVSDFLGHTAYGHELSKDVPYGRIGMEVLRAGSTLACATVLTTSIRASLFSVATAGALFAATTLATLAVAALIFNAIGIRITAGVEFCALAMGILSSPFSSAFLAKKIGFVSTSGQFFNLGLTAAVCATGLAYVGIVALRIYHAMFG